jgi:hypothetical protein
MLMDISFTTSCPDTQQNRRDRLPMMLRQIIPATVFVTTGTPSGKRRKHSTPHRRGDRPCRPDPLAGPAFVLPA